MYKTFSKAGFDISPEIKEQSMFMQIQQCWENLQSQGHTLQTAFLTNS